MIKTTFITAKETKWEATVSTFSKIKQKDTLKKSGGNLPEPSLLHYQELGMESNIPSLRRKWKWSPGLGFVTRLPTWYSEALCSAEPYDPHHWVKEPNLSKGVDLEDSTTLLLTSAEQGISLHLLGSREWELVCRGQCQVPCTLGHSRSWKPHI